MCTNPSSVALQARSISFSFSATSPLFTGLELNLPFTNHALVGKNGAGKTILGKVLALQIKPLKGEVKHFTKLGYLPQQAITHTKQTIAQYLHRDLQLDALTRIHKGSCDESDFSLVGDNWLLEQELAQLLDSYSLPKNPQQPLTDLSGGQQTRLALLKLELDNNDYLILDEPSNHLDYSARQWLYHWMEQQQGLLVISHDRELLAKVEHIHELSEGKLISYGGGLSLYQSQKTLQLNAIQQRVEQAGSQFKQLKKSHQQQKEKHQQSQKQGKKLRDGSQSKILLDKKKNNSENTQKRLRLQQEKSMVQAKQEVTQYQQLLARVDPLTLPLTTPNKQTGLLLQLDTISLPFTLHQGISGQVYGGDRIHLKGKNGSGKSSLLKAIMGKLSPHTGKISRLARLALLEQDQQCLDPTASALENFTLISPGWNESQYRTRLAQVRLRRDKALLPVSQLSGGEKVKVALTCLLCGPTAPDLILLDEPNNHLDLESLTLLEQTLTDYKGAILLVSHDQYFIEKLAIKQEWNL